MGLALGIRYMAAEDNLQHKTGELACPYVLRQPAGISPDAIT